MSLNRLLPIFFFILTGVVNSQYIEKADLKIKKSDSIIHAKDIVYQKDQKVIRFVDEREPYINKYIKVKNIENMELDSALYHTKVPELKETFTEYREGRGVYMTMDDLKNNVISERNFRAKKSGNNYEYIGDMLIVIDEDDKRIKDVAGLVWQGDVFVSLRHALKNLSKEVKGSFSVGHGKNVFIRVKYIDGHHLYFEVSKENISALNIIGGATGGLIGSALGSLIDSVISDNAGNYASMIYYDSDKKFHALKNCKRFNEHLEKRNKEFRFDCDDYNLNTIRDKAFNEL